MAKEKAKEKARRKMEKGKVKARVRASRRTAPTQLTKNPRLRRRRRNPLPQPKSIPSRIGTKLVMPMQR